MALHLTVIKKLQTGALKMLLMLIAGLYPGFLASYLLRPVLVTDKYWQRELAQ